MIITSYFYFFFICVYIATCQNNCGAATTSGHCYKYSYTLCWRSLFDIGFGTHRYLFTLRNMVCSPLYYSSNHLFYYGNCSTCIMDLYCTVYNGFIITNKISKITKHNYEVMNNKYWSCFKSNCTTEAYISNCLFSLILFNISPFYLHN